MSQSVMNSQWYDTEELKEKQMTVESEQPPVVTQYVDRLSDMSSPMKSHSKSPEKDPVAIAQSAINNIQELSNTYRRPAKRNNHFRTNSLPLDLHNIADSKD